MATDPNLTLDQKQSLKKREVSGAAQWLQDTFPGGTIEQNSLARGFGAARSEAPIAQADRTAQTAAAARVTDAESRAATPTTPGPSVFDNNKVPEAALSTGKELPGGLRRYQMDGGNEAQVYVGRGKHGETLFTDAPNDAMTRANLAGGLRKGDTGFDRTQGPNADREFGQNSLQRGGYDVLAGKDANGQPVSQTLTSRPDLHRELMAANSPQEILSYQDQLAASTYNDPETQAADRILANRLQARQSGLKARADEAGAGAAMTPATALGLARLRETSAFHKATLANQEAGLTRQDAAEQRQAVAGFNKALSDPAITPAQRDQLIAQQIPRGLSKKAFGDYLDTPMGQATSDALLNGPLTDGLKKSPWVFERGDLGAANSGAIGFANLDLDPKTGDFKGFNDNSSDPSNEFPRNGGVFGGASFNEGLLRSIPTDYWQVLKAKAAERRNFNATDSSGR